MNRFTHLLTWVVLSALYLPYLSSFIDLTSVQAADVTTNVAIQDTSCLAAAQLYYQPDVSQLNTAGVSVNEFITKDSISLLSDFATAERMSQITSPEYFTEVVATLGPVGIVQFTPSGISDPVIAVCSNYPRVFERDVFSPFSSVTPATISYALAAQESEKISFANPIDRYYLLGERCEGSLDFRLREEGQNPCSAFYPGDDVISNGQWDAPKVDRRVLETLVYLTTPTALGGAGREHIRIKKLVQSNTENEFNDISNSQSVVDLSPTETSSQTVADQTDATTVTTTVDGPASAYRINPDDPPYAPVTISTAVMIDEIDYLRVTTKTETRTFFGNVSGNNQVSYSYEAPTPIKVAWQTSDGLSTNPIPTFNQVSELENGRLVLNASIVNIMNQFGIGDLKIDVTNTEVSDFSDVARLVGQSLFEQLLGTSTGSLRGYDLASVLSNIGLAFAEQKLGLVPGSLANTNIFSSDNALTDFNDLALSIGRATVEYVMGYPIGSLKTTTGSSVEILEAIGRSHLENTIFKVEPGTLSASSGYEITTIGDLLARLGEGALEKKFQLPAQSTRVDSYEKVRETSRKASLLFPKIAGEWSRDQIDTANWISDQLKLSFMPVSSGATINTYGFSEKDFDLPSLSIAPTDWRKFTQLVGSRVIENTIGAFSRSGLAIIDKNGRVSSQKSYALRQEDYGEYDAELFPLMRSQTDGQVVNICEDAKGAFSNHWAKPATSAAYRAILGEMTVEGGVADQSYDRANITNASCEEVRSSSQNSLLDNYDLFTRIRTVLFETQSVTAKTLLNQDGAPQITDFRSGNKNDFRYAFYNIATLMYYNLPENHGLVSVNTIPYYNSQSTSRYSVKDDGSEDIVSLDLDDLTVAGELGNLIDELRGANNLSSRLSMLQNRLHDIEEVFSASNLADIPESNLDSELVTRLNLLTEKPAEGQAEYKDQYSDASYNGLLFLLEDLSSELSCLANSGGGTWKINSQGTEHFCSPTPENTPSAEQIYYVTKIKEKIDTLISGTIRPVTDALMSALSQGTYNDGTGYGQSAASNVANLPSTDYIEDANRRISLGVNGVSYSRDLIRALTSPATNADGSVPLGSSIEMFFSRGSDDRSLLGEVGRIRAAQTFNSDRLAQRSFTTFLQNTYGAAVRSGERVGDAAQRLVQSVGLADTNMQTAGVSTSATLDKGLASGDFQRLFQLDLGNQVFERVGKEELLRVLWQQNSITDRSQSSYQGILKQLGQYAQKIDFYNSRLDRLNQLNNSISSGVEELGDIGAELQKTIRSFSTEMQAARNSSSKVISEAIRRQEPTIANAKKELKRSGKTIAKLESDLNEYLHILQEIAAGESLPDSTQYSYSGSAYTANSTKHQSTECFSAVNLLESLRSGTGTLSNKLKSVASTVGGCAIETNLGLPTHTVSIWQNINQASFPPNPEVFEYSFIEDEYGETTKAFQTDPRDTSDFFAKQADGSYTTTVPAWNKQSYSVNSLEVAIGLADSLNRKAGRLTDVVDTDKAYLLLSRSTAAEVNTLASSGKRILQNTALAKLASLIPGFSSFTRSNGLTPRDIVKIFTGDMRPLIGKVGGSQIDKILGFPTGTINSIIYPTCYNNQGQVVGCVNDPNQPGTNASNIALQNFLVAGLDKIGAQAPNFPRYFSFKNAGTITEAWGNALITEKMGLAPNSFRGKLGTNAEARASNCDAQTVRCSNSNLQLSRSFGFGTTPYQRLFDSIISTTKEVFRGAAVGESESKHWLEILSQSRENYVFSSTFGLISQTDFEQEAGYWTDTHEANSVQVKLNELNSRELSIFQSAIGTLWQSVAQDTANSEDLIAEARRSILQAIENYLGSQDVSDFRSLLSSGGYIAQYANPTTPLPTITSSSQQTENNLDTYRVLANNFQYRLSTLDKTYTLDPKGDSFEAFALNRITGDRLSAQIGGDKGYFNSYMTNVLDDWLQNSAPDVLRSADQFLRIATTDPAICGHEEGLGKFLANLATNPNSSVTCGFRGLSNLSMQEFLQSPDATNTALRFFMIDTVVGRGTLHNLESGLGLRSGALARVISRPRQAAQILTQETIVMLHDQIFGDTKNQNCNANQLATDTSCASKALMTAFSNAFFSGFCPSYSNLTRNQAPIDQVDNNPFTDEGPGEPMLGGDNCSFSFDKQRSGKTFSDTMYRYVDATTKAIARKNLGISLSTSDVRLLFAGDSRAINLIGTQLLVNQIQGRVFKDRPNDRNLRYYAISYQEVRDSVGLFTSRSSLPNTSDLQQIAMQRELCANGSLAACSDATTNFTDIEGGYYASYRTTFANQLKSDISSGRYSAETAALLFPATDIDHNGHVDADELNQYSNLRTNDASDPGVILANRSLSFDTQRIRQEKERKLQVDSQNRIMYKLLDVAAYGFDQNIPPGFSSRMLSGDQAQLVDALGNYFFTGLMRGSGVLSNVVHDVCGNSNDTGNIQSCYDFVNTIGAALKEKDPTARNADWQAVLLNDRFMNGLDSAVSNVLSNSLDLNLPDGAVTGLIAWQLSGGQWKDVNKDTITVGGRNFVPIGRLIQSDLTSQALRWFSSQTHMPMREVRSLYNLTNGAIKLIKLQSMSKNLTTAANLADNIADAASGYVSPEYALALDEDANAATQKLASNQDAIAKQQAEVATILVDFAVDHFGLTKYFANLDKQLGLPSGTMDIVGKAVLLMGALMISGLGAAAAASAAFGPAFFIGLGFALVFGVTAIKVRVYASGDGNYPFYNHGDGEAAKRGSPPYREHYTSDREIGDFSAIDITQYKQKIKDLAREKVRGLIVDLLAMPNSQYAEDRGFVTNPAELNEKNQSALWVAQLFTYFNPNEGDEANPLKESDTLVQSLLNSNSPYASGKDIYGNQLQPGWGYGPPSIQCSSVVLSNDGKDVCYRNEAILSGMFAVKNKSLLEGIHLAF